MHRRNFEHARRQPPESCDMQTGNAKDMQGDIQKKAQLPEMRRAQPSRHRARTQRVPSMHASPTVNHTSSVSAAGTVTSTTRQSALRRTAITAFSNTPTEAVLTKSEQVPSISNTIEDNSNVRRGYENKQNSQHQTNIARAPPKDSSLRSILKRNDDCQEPTSASQITFPSRMRKMAETYLEEVLAQSGPDCSREEVVSQVHTAILAAEAGVKSAFDINATDDKYEADIRASKSETLFCATMDTGLHIGPSAKEEQKAGRKCRFSGANDEAPKVLEKADALFEGDLVDIVAQLFDAKVSIGSAKKLPSTPGPRRRPLRRTLRSEEEQEAIVRHAEEEQCLPAASKKRGFAEVEAEFKTPKRRRWVEDDEEDDKKKGNPMKRRKSRGVTEMCLEHVMLDERDATEEQRAEAIERFYAPLHRGSAKCVELMFKSVLGKGDK